MATNTEAAPLKDRPSVPHSSDGRKQQVLTKGRASVVRSITDAVVAKDGEPFFLCEPDGQVPVDGRHGYGLYHHDCRFLAGYELTLGGRKPDALAATETSATTLLVELTNPDLAGDAGTVPKEQVGITWSRTVDASGVALRDELAIRNYGSDPVELPVELRFAAGFEDVFLIRGLLGEQPGEKHGPSWDDDRLHFSYSGGDGIERSIAISVDRRPEQRRDDGVQLRVHLDGRASATIHVDVEISERVIGDAPPIEGRGSPKGQPTGSRQRLDRQADRGSQSGRTQAEEGWIGGSGWAMSARTSSFALRSALARSLDDLAQLRSELDGWRYYEAGIPWFATLFGRDSLIAALQSLPWDPDIAAETLRLLASRQGRHEDAWRDEQPGRILHELRIGELARMGEIPHTPYYGTVDATPLFLIVLGHHAAWTGSLTLYDELRDHVDAALGWLDRYADSDGDGFVDYGSHAEHGLVNQGWKDSGDAIVMADGTIARPPIALAEVQGYAYRAWLEIADLAERSGDAGRASELRAKSDRIRDRFEARFWSDRLGCYVLALADGDPCEVVTSNAGQVLWSGIASDERARKVADRLLRDDMFGGWGIRTLSTDAVAFHPVGYHLGTVWPHDNSLIAAGFARYGMGDAAERLFVALLEASHRFPHDRLPECFAGFGRDRFEVPVRYPVACHPQAWAAGALPYLLTTSLGLDPDGFARRLSIRSPRLPAGIEWVELRGLPIAGGSADVRFDRTESGAATVSIVGTTDGVTVDVPGDAGASRAES